VVLTLPWIVSFCAPTTVWLPLPRVMYDPLCLLDPVTESTTKKLPPPSTSFVPVRNPFSRVPPASFMLLWNPGSGFGTPPAVVF